MDLNKVLYGNSVDVMKTFPDNLVDMTITSPPYDSMRRYEGGSYDFEMFKGQAEQLYRITKEGGVVVWVVRDGTKNGSESGTSFKQALYFMECGFKLYDTMIYAKNYFVPLTHRRYEQQFEYMFVFSKGRPKTFNGLREKCGYEGTKQPTEWNAAASDDNCALRKRVGGYVTKATKLRPNIWWYSPGKRLESDNVANKHPAIFPWDLARDQIISWSDEGDLVFDPMSGSGTSLVVAKMNNRNYLGIDIVEKYVKIANERLERLND